MWLPEVSARTGCATVTCSFIQQFSDAVREAIYPGGRKFSLPMRKPLVVASAFLSKAFRFGRPLAPPAPGSVAHASSTPRYQTIRMKVVGSDLPLQQTWMTLYEDTPSIVMCHACCGKYMAHIAVARIKLEQVCKEPFRTFPVSR